MKIIVQNLQKRSGLASQVAHEHEPDIFLAQEISISTEEASFQEREVCTTSKLGYGTAIFCKKGSASLSNVRHVTSPHAEVGGLIHKKTTIASYCEHIELVSFHGYNGQPFKNAQKLEDHVDAVLSRMQKKGPAVFAGDFNTWSQHHVDAVEKRMTLAGFRKVFSWPYPGREVPLDHLFVRSMRLQEASVYSNESDHNGAVLELYSF